MSTESRPRESSKSGYDAVAIAASAGGLHALIAVLEHLPPTFPASVFIVQHLDPNHRSLMPEILRHSTRLVVKQARHGDAIIAGTVYVAIPDYHMIVNPDHTISLTKTELVHYVRPSADLLFSSIALVYDSRAIAVVLSGSGSDGSIGIQTVKQAGGLVIAQDEASSDFFGMPGAAIKTQCVDMILPLHDIAGALIDLVENGEKS